MSKKKKRIKIRRTWGNINPVERIVPNKKHKAEKKLTTKDLLDLERGLK
jgi:hypothetical protein